MKFEPGYEFNTTAFIIFVNTDILAYFISIFKLLHDGMKKTLKAIPFFRREKLKAIVRKYKLV